MSLEFLSLETIEKIAEQYGYLAIFLGILLENLGIPLPGETVTLVGGFLAGSGQLSYWLVLLSAASGAVIGGTIGYWLGRLGGLPLLLKFGQLFRIPEAKIEKIRTQFSENAAKAVFFGRFVALLRIFASPIAGIAQMPFWQFMLCNLAGAAIWASVMVSLSFAGGRVIPLEQMVSSAAQFAIGVLLFVIAWIVIPLWLENRRERMEAVEAEDKLN